MNWLGLGISAWVIRLRELEHFGWRIGRVSRSEPEAELPDAEISDGEQREALRRAADQRWLRERA